MSRRPVGITERRQRLKMTRRLQTAVAESEPKEKKAPVKKPVKRTKKATVKKSTPMGATKSKSEK